MCRSSVEIAETIKRARANTHNAWVSISCFGGTRRSAKEAVDCRMIGVDIDLKSGDIPPFDSKTQALEYVLRTPEIGLPLPTFTIDSGHGIHLWYVLDKVLPRERWVEVSSAMWAALGSVHTGFVTDPSRKRDAAGLLRLPYTTNTKRDKETKQLLPGAETTILEDYSTGAEIDHDQLVEVLARFGDITRTMPPPLPGKVFAPIEYRSRTETDLTVPSMMPVVANCKVLRHAYEHQDQMGYNEWWPMIASCAWASDGREVAHAMSLRHPNYDHASVDQKFDDFADGDSLPPSCAYLATSIMGDNSACLDCACHMTGRKWPHQHPAVQDALKIDETLLPVQLAEPTSEESPIRCEAPNTPEPAETLASSPIPSHVTDTGSRFYATEDLRMVMKSKNEDGEPIILQLADHAVWGERFIWNPIEQRTEIGFGTARYGRDRKLIRGEVQVPARYISGEWSGMAAPFADSGVALAAVLPKTKNAFREYLIAEQSRVRDEARAVEVAHHGWQPDGSFAAANHVFTKGSSRPARLTASAKAHEQRFARRGSADEQKAILKLYGERGSAVSKFVLGLSAGSPAHGFRERGGTITALVGRTSLGKTKMCEFAASFWGRPDMLLIRPEATIKSVYEMIGTARNLPSWVDEITYSDKSDLIRMVHQIAAGGGRGALNRNGQARAVEAVPAWASSVVWTSNTSIVQQLRGISDAERAVALRVLELRVAGATLTLDDPTRLATLDRAYTQNCGHVGAMLAERYANHRDQLEAAHEAVLDDVAKILPGGASGPYRYWVQALQTFETGAAALHDMGLIAMDAEQRKRIRDDLARQALADAGMVDMQVVDAIRQYVNENIERMVTLRTVIENGKTVSQSYIPATGAVGRLEVDEPNGIIRARLNVTRFEEWLDRRSSTLDAVIHKAQGEGLLRRDARASADIYAGCTRLDRAGRGMSRGVEAPLVTFWLPMKVDQVAEARAKQAASV